MNIAVVGVGLMGGSIMLKLKQKHFPIKAFGIDNNTSHLEKALELGIIDEIVTLEEGLKIADLIILAIPVNATKTLLPKVLDNIY